MTVTADTRNTGRQRNRPGRKGFYYPTVAEQTTFGAGPFPAFVCHCNADASLDIVVEFPAPIGGYATIDNTWDANEAGILTDLAPTAHKLGVKANNQPGGFGFVGATLS